MKDNYIKFTFNVDKVFESLKGKDFSEPRIKQCQINFDRLITQKDVYKRLPKEYLNNETKKGFCVLVSIYNAFEDIFENVNELIGFSINQLKTGKKFSKLQVMSREINLYKNAKLLFSENNLQDSYNIFVSNILQNKPVVISYQLKDLGKNTYVSHVVTLIGYDEYFIYYIENSEDDYLFRSLAHYVVNYYRTYPISKDNPEYKRLTNLLNEANEEELWKLIKDILGYNKRGKMSMIKKDFLTNDKYFYDLNRMVTYTNDIKIPDECGDTNNCNFSLSSLTDRLQKLNY